MNKAVRNQEPKLVLPVGFRADDDAMKELAKVRKELEDSIIEIS